MEQPRRPGSREVLRELATIARHYLRKYAADLPTAWLVPDRHLVIREMVAMAREQLKNELSDEEVAAQLPLILFFAAENSRADAKRKKDSGKGIGPLRFTLPQFDQRALAGIKSARAASKRTRADPELLVVAVLVAWGVGEKAARKMVENALKNA